MAVRRCNCSPACRAASSVRRCFIPAPNATGTKTEVIFDLSSRTSQVETFTGPLAKWRCRSIPGLQRPGRHRHKYGDHLRSVVRRFGRESDHQPARRRYQQSRVFHRHRRNRHPHAERYRLQRRHFAGRDICRFGLAEWGYRPISGLQRPDGTGTNTATIYDLSSGGSVEYLLGNLPSGVTSEAEYFTGTDATGTETQDVIDFQRRHLAG